MQVFPTIELLDGRCVSLHRGRLDEPQIWHVDPIAKAREFAEAGAEWIHVTDFDAIGGSGQNSELIGNIIDQCGASVQLGGGFRSLAQITEWIDRGAGRIVVSTLAVLQPEIVKEAAHLYPDQIVIAVDVFQGQLMSDGWRSSSAIDPMVFVSAFETDPLAGIIVSDIDADLDESDVPLALVTAIAGIAKAPVFARGLSRSLDDLARLKYVPYVSGALISRALFDRSVELADALELGNQVPEQTAEFV